MRVLVDGTPLLLPGGGVKSYVYNLVVSLRKLAKEHIDVRVFPFLDGFRGLTHERSVLGWASTLPRLAFVRFANSRHTPLMDLFGRGIDLFHQTNTHVLYPPRNTRLTGTIHDVTCWLMPQLHVGSNVRETKWFFESMRTRMDAWIAVSKSTRDEAVEAIRIPADRIEVVHPGIPDEFFDVTPEAVAGVKEKYGLIRPYVLDVCVLEPRKNVGALVTAYERLPQYIRADIDLVVAGPVGWGDARVLERIRSGIRGVRYLGYVRETDLPALTAGATVFAYPSLYEGFGLPVVQAMAAGVPVLTSNVSALPEITGGAALLADPVNTEEISSALQALLLSPSLRSGLAQKSARHAAAYRWQHSAAKTLDFFNMVCCGGE